MTEQSGSQQGMTGKTIGQYELEQEIGRGGMATVYSARQLSMNRMVAIKVLPRHFLLKWQQYIPPSERLQQ